MKGQVERVATLPHLPRAQSEPTPQTTKHTLAYNTQQVSNSRWVARASSRERISGNYGHRERGLSTVAASCKCPLPLLTGIALYAFCNDRHCLAQIPPIWEDVSFPQPVLPR